MKKTAQTKSSKVKPARPRPKKLVLVGGLFAIAVAAVLAMWAVSRKSNAVVPYSPRPSGTLTFTKDIAPIVFKNCASCHRPGQSAPFSLLTYQDVKKHAQQIAEVTQKRFMPPWLPKPGYGDFADPRVLSLDQIGVIQQWVAEGAIEGQAVDLPSSPHWTDGWQLGPPDLVLTMPRPYMLGPEGKDVYRNFVIPIPVSSRRFVQAIEFQAGNKSVHHTFLKFDRTRESRRLDEKDPEPGFSGMQTPSSAGGPDGFFLGWPPGKVPRREPEGFCWPLEKGTDLVLAMHLQPTGKPELIQASIGFYFTDRPPTVRPFKIALSSLAIDIPAGIKDYAVTDSFTLPVDVNVLAVAPHAHNLGKELQGYAVLPNGRKQWLFLIENWDFNWQGDYRYAKPVFLPKGSQLIMQFSYDNSMANLRNPNHPPKRVKYGVQSTDEMGEVYFQLLLPNHADRDKLVADYSAKMMKDVIAYNEYLLGIDSNDAKAHNELGKAKLAQGRDAEALAHFRAAAQIQPDFDEAHYHLGVMAQELGKIATAQAAYKLALRLNPENFEAHNNLGLIFLEQGELAQAEYHFDSVMRLNPDDTIARDNLELVKRARASRKKKN